MTTFTVEETNLLIIYKASSKRELLENISAALPFMDEEMRMFAEHTMRKLDALTEAEFAALSLDPAEDV